MTDVQQESHPQDSAPRLDELLDTIRAALSQDARADARSAGAIACQAILGVLQPSGRAHTAASASSPATSPLAALLGTLGQIPTAAAATSPSRLGAVLGAISQIPREQLLEAIGGLRWLLGQQGPTYRTPPTTAPTRPPSGGV